MAGKLGISQSSYSKIENGEIDLTFSRLEEIATIFGLQVENVICFNPEGLTFNVSNNKQGIGLNVNTSISQNEKEIYDSFIKTLKDEITHLKSILKQFLGKDIKKQIVKKKNG